VGKTALLVVFLGMYGSVLIQHSDVQSRSMSIMDVTSASASHVVGGSGHDSPSTSEPKTAAVST
jgi:hypothetical protein